MSCSPTQAYSVRARLGPILSSRGSWRRSGSAAESKSCDRPEANLSTPKRCQCSETRNSRKVSDQAMPDCNPLLWNEENGRASCRKECVVRVDIGGSRFIKKKTKKQ